MGSPVNAEEGSLSRSGWQGYSREGLHLEDPVRHVIQLLGRSVPGEANTWRYKELKEQCQPQADGSWQILVSSSMGKRKEIEGKCITLSNRAETQSPELGPRIRREIGQSFLVLVLLVSGPLRSFHMEIQGEQSLNCTKGLNSFRLED